MRLSTLIKTITSKATRYVDGEEEEVKVRPGGVGGRRFCRESPVAERGGHVRALVGVAGSTPAEVFGNSLKVLQWPSTNIARLIAIQCKNCTMAPTATTSEILTQDTSRHHDGILSAENGQQYVDPWAHSTGAEWWTNVNEWTTDSAAGFRMSSSS